MMGPWETPRPGTLIHVELLPLPILGMVGSVVHADLFLSVKWGCREPLRQCG